MVKNKKELPQEPSESDDRVVLHQFQRTKTCPNMSPFCVKVEAYLKLHDIPYTPVYSDETSDAPYGKKPYIVHLRKKIADSTSIIAHLSNHFKITMDAHLGIQEAATALAFQRLIEEHLYFVGVSETFVQDHGWSKLSSSYATGPFRFLAKPKLGMMRRQVRTAVQGQGIGRLPFTEAIDRAKADLQAISDFLDDKTYLMGEEISTVDLSLFGVVAATVYTDFSPELAAAIRDHANIMEHTERLMESLFGDYEKIAKPKREEIDADVSKMNLSKTLSRRGINRQSKVPDEESAPQIPESTVNGPKEEEKEESKAEE